MRHFDFDFNRTYDNFVIVGGYFCTKIRLISVGGGSFSNFKFKIIGAGVDGCIRESIFGPVIPEYGDLAVTVCCVIVRGYGHGLTVVRFILVHAVFKFKRGSCLPVKYINAYFVFAGRCVFNRNEVSSVFVKIVLDGKVARAVTPQFITLSIHILHRIVENCRYIR